MAEHNTADAIRQDAPRPVVVDFSVTLEVLRTMSAAFDCACEAERAGSTETAAMLVKFADKLAGQFLSPVVVVQN